MPVTISDALCATQARSSGPRTTGAALSLAVRAGSYWADGLRVVPSSLALANRGDENWPGSTELLAAAPEGVDEHSDLVGHRRGPNLAGCS